MYLVVNNKYYHYSTNTNLLDKKSAGYHHTHLRSATTLYRIWEACTLASFIFGIYCSFTFEVAVRGANEQYVLHSLQNAGAKIEIISKTTKLLSEKMEE